MNNYEEFKKYMENKYEGNEKNPLEISLKIVSLIKLFEEAGKNADFLYAELGKYYYQAFKDAREHDQFEDAMEHNHE